LEHCERRLIALFHEPELHQHDSSGDDDGVTTKKAQTSKARIPSGPQVIVLRWHLLASE